MNKKVSIKKTSAIFLAIVLVAGIIALSPPSFMVGAQAESEDDELNNNDNKLYGIDNDESSDELSDDAKDNDESSDDELVNNVKPFGNNNYEVKELSYVNDDNNSYKSKDSSSVFVKKVKCNNINVNLNGLDVDIGLPNGNGPLNGPLAEAQAVNDEGQESNSFGSDLSNSGDGQSDSNTNYRVVCINNNNNIIVEEEEEPLEPQTCEECFTTFLTEEQIERFIEVLDNPRITSLEEACGFLLLFGAGQEELFILGLETLLGLSEDNAVALVECLKNVGVEFSEEPPM